MPKYKQEKIQKDKILIAKIQIQQKTNATKYKCKNDKIQTRQNTKEQNIIYQNSNVTKY